ncbi:hypothetical protein K432DRAFT_382629 [Lepidopterella palustris CBS 459.81]|uniref:Uncharacterized protein n=1 Tax=Lepidopterella palustris CBS 459.81 TaxID=1314670 RepID=A0A8E2JEU3_9PEZI|nr:hypothetical protein K432DRAFT_382629 [Lepidopterella palustris CBS 459.81]
MFGFSTSTSLLAGQHDAKKERDPPSLPTPVTFPSFVPPVPSLSGIPPAWSGGCSPSLFTRFINLRTPSDVDIDTLTTLNVSFKSECDFETLLSTLPDGPSYLPPKSWLESPEGRDSPEPASSEPQNRLLSNGRKPPDRKDFYTRVKELYFKNEDAFAVLTRVGKSGQPPPRLAHFRRFWEGLDNMAYYWDDSLDEYIPPKPEETTNSETTSMNLDEPRKKVKTAAEPPEEPSFPTQQSTAASSHSIVSSSSLPARTQPPKVPSSQLSPPSKPVGIIPGTYRGNRIGNGAEMPDQYRLDTVRSFLEPIAWAFGLTFAPHRRPPALAIKTMRFPVRMNTVAWRAPADRMKARSGWLEGPVFGVQCRPDTAFGTSGSLEAESVLDIIRELGGLFLLAQERAREGKAEKKPGEGKWWVTEPRWGGGPGGEVGEGSGGSDAPIEKEDEKPGRSRPSAKERRKLSAAEAWKVLKPGSGVWDPKIAYEAIGRNRSVDWDEVFMVSSLNHHISILKLRIHPLYLQYLTDGDFPTDPPLDPSWSSPILQRTRWYDFFNVEDRAEAMRGIWGVMAYMMRTQEKPDVTMNDG